MKHFIIVKFVDSVNVFQLVQPIKELFEGALEIDGVSEVEVKVRNTDRSNRYDLMIQMELTPSALNIYDASQLHRQWKEEYGKLIANKTIFDCD